MQQKSSLKKVSRVKQSLFILGASTLMIGGIGVSSSLADTTTSTDPKTILGTFKASTDSVDDIGGAAAAMGMSTCVFGGGALIFKRFIYA
jgi:hypothetical protein